MSTEMSSDEGQRTEQGSSVILLESGDDNNNNNAVTAPDNRKDHEEDTSITSNLSSSTEQDVHEEKGKAKEDEDDGNNLKMADDDGNNKNNNNEKDWEEVQVEEPKIETEDTNPKHVVDKTSTATTAQSTHTGDTTDDIENTKRNDHQASSSVPLQERNDIAMKKKTKRRPRNERRIGSQHQELSSSSSSSSSEQAQEKNSSQHHQPAWRSRTSHHGDLTAEGKKERRHRNHRHEGQDGDTTSTASQGISTEDTEIEEALKPPSFRSTDEVAGDDSNSSRYNGNEDDATDDAGEATLKRQIFQNRTNPTAYYESEEQDQDEEKYPPYTQQPGAVRVSSSYDTAVRSISITSQSSNTIMPPLIEAEIYEEVESPFLPIASVVVPDDNSSGRVDPAEVEARIQAAVQEALRQRDLELQQLHAEFPRIQAAVQEEFQERNLERQQMRDMTLMEQESQQQQQQQKGEQQYEEEKEEESAQRDHSQLQQQQRRQDQSFPATATMIHGGTNPIVEHVFIDGEDDHDHQDNDEENQLNTLGTATTSSGNANPGTDTNRNYDGDDDDDIAHPKNPFQKIQNLEFENNSLCFCGCWYYLCMKPPHPRGWRILGLYVCLVALVAILMFSWLIPKRLVHPDLNAPGGITFPPKIIDEETLSPTSSSPTLTPMHY